MEAMGDRGRRRRRAPMLAEASAFVGRGVGLVARLRRGWKIVCVAAFTWPRDAGSRNFSVGASFRKGVCCGLNRYLKGVKRGAEDVVGDIQKNG